MEKEKVYLGIKCHADFALKCFECPYRRLPMTDCHIQLARDVAFMLGTAANAETPTAPKEGDTVFVAFVCEKEVWPYKIVKIAQETKYYMVSEEEEAYFTPEDIGDTVFFTREEAEAALFTEHSKEKKETYNGTTDI